MKYNCDLYGPLILRISLGAVLIAHSIYLKLVIYGLDNTAGYFVSIGLPSFFAYVVFVTEAIAGTLLIIGLKVRLSALASVPILLGATWAHSGNGWVFTAENGGWEYPLFLTFTAIAVSLIGSGAYSLDRRINNK